MVPPQNPLWHLLTALPAALYGSLMRFRNHLYDIGNKPEIHFELPVISVGNLAVGGTGKTPMTEYLIRLLIPEKKIAVLSRGYGRKTKGFLLANAEATAATIGDEPMQYFTKFGNRIVVAVGEDRVAAVPEILFAHPETEVILLDDAYQHRKIGRRLNLLLTEYSHPFYEDFVMPRGSLRESRSGANRADAVIVTKCLPTITADNRSQITAAVRRYAKPETPVFFTGITYAPPQFFWGTTPNLNRGEKVILVSGIAKHQAWADAMQKQFAIAAGYHFADHHQYQMKDVATIISACQKHEAVLLCTEKDMVKLKPLLQQIHAPVTAFFQPVSVQFLSDESLFKQLIFNTLQQ
ncbi:tetraacyldisaccharide 4'-kinase [Rhodoflexus caldus]|uniref:tetraacyldisaccharide 4'-kinase n=1 Tax=Rhodoflexus caldus TaxID=2891236 RepID=UPI00202A2446|nr:tetraacyldisaccharide 4'-kinase [Rhodoflexus caldus]